MPRLHGRGREIREDLGDRRGELGGDQLTALTPPPGTSEGHASGQPVVGLLPRVANRRQPDRLGERPDERLDRPHRPHRPLDLCDRHHEHVGPPPDAGRTTKRRQATTTAPLLPVAKSLATVS